MDPVAVQDHGANDAGPSVTPPVLRKIPRPPNAFILYRSNKMKELKNKKNSNSLADTGLDKLDYQRQLSKVIGQLWRDESEQVKATFYEKAQQAAREHKERYPEYRFKPAGVKKASSRETEIPAIAAGAAPNIAPPESKGDTDFSPGHLSGPLSGSGSGSGRKRASLEGARSKTSPYSTTSRHRRTSSTDPSSPTAHRPSLSQSQQRAPVLVYAADDPAGRPADGVPLTRSVSFGAPSQRSGQRRSTKAPARRSLDGQIAQATNANHSFDTLVPQHLRDNRVFLAPHQPPPLPIGLAITTDEPSTFHEVHEQQQHRVQKPKCSLFDAVRSALPPERRAFLEQSLAMKGLSYAVEANAHDRAAPSWTRNESTAPFAQSDSWNSMTSAASEMGTSHTWQSQEITSNPSSQSSYSTPFSELPPHLDPANQAPVDASVYTGHHVNLHMSASDSAKYAGLAEWSQPDPSFLGHAQSYPSSSANGAPPPPFGSNIYTGHSGADGRVQQSQNAHYEPQFHYAQPLPCFGYVDTAQDAPSNYEINHSNSAFVALSEPDSTGQVYGHFYGLDGQLIGQGTVPGTDLGSHGSQEYLDEEARQRRAVDQLLMQMMTSSNPSGAALDCPLHPDLVDMGASQVQGETQEPSSSAYDPAQWQSWSQQPSVKLEDNVDQGVSQLRLVNASSQAECFEPNAFELHSPSVVPVPTSQEWMDASTQVQDHAQLASPRTSRNFSRPMIYDASPQEFKSHSSTATPSTPSPPSIANAQVQHEAAQDQPATIDPAQLTRRPEPEPDQLRQEPQHQATESDPERSSEEPQPQAKENLPQSVHQSLRNWKANRLSSFKDKLARVRHKATPSTSSLDQVKDRDAKDGV